MGKTCTICLLIKPLDAFGESKKSTDGRRQPCSQCRREAYAAWRAAHPLPSRNAPNAKRCKDCGETKPLTEFPTHLSAAKKARSRGVRIPESRCRLCHNAYKALLYAARCIVNPLPNPQTKKTKALYRKAHPEKALTVEANRRARKAGATITDLTHGQWREILLAFNYRCVYCPPDCKLCQKKTHKLTKDHITSVAERGNYTLHNIVPSCQPCNSKKGKKPPPVPVQPLLLTIAPSKKKKNS